MREARCKRRELNAGSLVLGLSKQLKVDKAISYFDT